MSWLLHHSWGMMWWLSTFSPRKSCAVSFMRRAFTPSRAPDKRIRIVFRRSASKADSLTVEGKGPPFNHDDTSTRSRDICDWFAYLVFTGSALASTTRRRALLATTSGTALRSCWPTATRSHCSLCDRVSMRELLLDHARAMPCGLDRLSRDNHVRREWAIGMCAQKGGEARRSVGRFVPSLPRCRLVCPPLLCGDCAGSLHGQLSPDRIA
jgi:hypothetical protein